VPLQQRVGHRLKDSILNVPLQRSQANQFTGV